MNGKAILPFTTWITFVQRQLLEQAKIRAVGMPTAFPATTTTGNLIKMYKESCRPMDKCIHTYSGWLWLRSLRFSLLFLHQHLINNCVPIILTDFVFTTGEPICCQSQRKVGYCCEDLFLLKTTMAHSSGPLKKYTVFFPAFDVTTTQTISLHFRIAPNYPTIVSTVHLARATSETLAETPKNNLNISV